MECGYWRLGIMQVKEGGMHVQKAWVGVDALRWLAGDKWRGWDALAGSPLGRWRLGHHGEFLEERDLVCMVDP